MFGVVGATHSRPAWVPIVIGIVGLLFVALTRFIPKDSAPGKVAAWLVTRQGQYDLSPGRLVVVVVVSFGLIALGIALVSTGH